ncbi:MAG: hypothetical protein LBU32_03205 [Clostridiales bacterium]|nr:hypothetical protein [Clostridiales bacterium]
MPKGGGIRRITTLMNKSSMLWFGCVRFSVTLRGVVENAVLKVGDADSIAMQSCCDRQ